MRLASEIEKDAKQFLREKRTLMLLIVAPLLVLFTMGAIFSGDSTLVGKSAIGVCDLDQSNSSKFFLSGINESSEIVRYAETAGCGAELGADVREGKLAAGIIIPAGFEAGMETGEPQGISLLLDNSRFQVSPSIEAFVKANVQETNRRMGAQFILSVWQKLDSANERLGTIFAEMEKTRERAGEMKADLNMTKDSLNALNTSEVRDEIGLANQTVADALVALGNAEGNLTEIESDFAGYQEALNQTEADLLEINATLANATGYIEGARAGVNCSDMIFTAYCLSLDSLNSSVGNAQASVEQRIGKVRDAQAGLEEANQTIQEFKASIASAMGSAGEAEARIGGMLEFVDELEANRAEALRTIAEVESSIDELVLKTYELESIIAESRGQISGITSSSPEFVLSPMVVAPEYTFGRRPFFEFMLPSVIPLILMFVSLFLSSTSLVKEKYGGTFSRVCVSQVNRFKYAAVKVLSYSIVLLPEAVLLLLIASVFYHAFPVSDLGVWLYSLQSLAFMTLAFVSIGILIALYSESEATAFLASLVVGLPLLFLSGLLFPFEFMPPLVSMLGMLSPLTQAVVGMQATLLYNSPQLAGSALLLAYSVAFTLLAGLSLKK